MADKTIRSAAPILADALQRADDLLMRGLTADAHEEIRRGLRDIGIDPMPDNPHLKVTPCRLR